MKINLNAAWWPRRKLGAELDRLSGEIDEAWAKGKVRVLWSWRMPWGECVVETCEVYSTDEPAPVEAT